MINSAIAKTFFNDFRAEVQGTGSQSEVAVNYPIVSYLIFKAIKIIAIVGLCSRRERRMFAPMFYSMHYVYTSA